jgi:hypothetical protein
VLAQKGEVAGAYRERCFEDGTREAVPLLACE